MGRWLVMLTTLGLLTGCGAAVEEPDIAAGAPSSIAAGTRPDFSGVWTNASLTTLVRPEQIDTLVLTPEQAQQLADSNFHNVRAAEDAEISDPDRAAPEKLDRLPPVGNYSANWVDPGSRYSVVGGEIRSSWIIDPEDGQLPFTAKAKADSEARRAARQGMPDPEVLSVGERCLLGFGGSGGPPMLNVLYNNFYRIVQTPDYLMILAEMVHDARIIPLDGSEPVEGDLRWLGSSSARFDGDTLVIRTTNFHPTRARTGPIPLSSDAVVIERLRRVDAETLYYGFEIIDPILYTQPVIGEMSFQRRDQRVYEYACHEGNYAVPSMLRGARLEDAEAELLQGTAE